MTKDMPTNFFSLPRETRDQIYELVLLDQEVICPRPKEAREYHGCPQLNLELLRVNSTIHREASPLFYGKNIFDFDILPYSGKEGLFLQRIGRNNADCIRAVCVGFPYSSRTEAGNFTLKKEVIELFANIQSSCPNLRTLRTTRESMYAVQENQHRILRNFKVFADALKLIDNHFRSILSLKEIIIQVYKDSLCKKIRKKMGRRGWTVDVAAYTQEEYDSYFRIHNSEEDYDSDFEDDYWDYYEGDHEDDYGYDHMCGNENCRCMGF